MTDRSVENFWEIAPSGHVIAHLDGRIIRVNATLARWLGYEPNALCGRVFTELLTVGGRILYDTHFGPLLHMGSDLNGVTVDVVTANGTRLPMFLTANVGWMLTKSRNCCRSPSWTPPIAVPTKWSSCRPVSKRNPSRHAFACSPKPCGVHCCRRCSPLPMT